MAEGHEYKTVFTIWYSTYEWLLLPLGLTNTLSTFRNLMNSIFSDMLDESLLVYLDNLLIFSTDIESHYDDVHKNLEQLHQNKLRQKVASVNLLLPKLSTLAKL